MLARDGTKSRERWNRRGRRFATLLAAVAVSALLYAPAKTQAEPEKPGPDITGSIASGGVATIGRILALEAERKETAEDLANLAATISLTEESIHSLDSEIASLAADRDKIRAAMIEAAAAQKAIETDIAATETRIAGLAADEATQKASLRARRGLLAEVLGALERMGRKPPPALLVRPDDALGSVRSAILLGAVVPRIRKETETLVVDLDRLTAVKREIAAEKDRYLAGMTKQRAEEARLARLFEEKEKLEAGNRDRRAAESA
ncbi:MAG: hypothetical protein H7Y08_06505, partial [Rhizobiaceae bacterium]|nr:hypothetical protein [Rhizobiaceae bacterium]